VLGSFDKDGKANLVYRLREGTGLGYEVISSPVTEISVFGGVTLVQERFEDLEQTRDPEGLASVELKSSVLSPVTFTTRGQLTPSFRRGRYLFEWISGLSVPLFGRLNYGVGLTESYNSSPPEGTKKNDVRLISTLGLTF
jgi:hypothetical protein